MRRPCLRRSAAALVLAASVGLAGLGPAPAATAATSTDLRAQVAALQVDVERTSAALEAGARAADDAQQRLGRLTQEQFAVADRLAAERAAAAAGRASVDALVRSAYIGTGLPPEVSAFLSGDPRALGDLARVRSAVGRADAEGRAGLAATSARSDRTAALLVRADRLRRRTLAAGQDAERARVALATRAADLADRLTRTAAALDDALTREAQAAARDAATRAAATRAAAAAASARAAAAAGTDLPVGPGAATYTPGPVTPGPGGGCDPADPGGYANGFLPDAVLCPLPGRPGERLRTDAAQAFVAMDTARRAQGLPPLCVTDSYRSYAGQVAVFASRPGLAAVPGRSQHGWGLALDLCGGVERFDGEPHLWLLAHAPAYGWVHPAWAEPGGSLPEPWHWEYQGGARGGDAPQT